MKKKLARTSRPRGMAPRITTAELRRRAEDMRERLHESDLPAPPRRIATGLAAAALAVPIGLFVGKLLRSRR